MTVSLGWLAFEIVQLNFPIVARPFLSASPSSNPVWLSTTVCVRLLEIVFSPKKPKKLMDSELKLCSDRKKLCSMGPLPSGPFRLKVNRSVLKAHKKAKLKMGLRFCDTVT